MRNSRPLWALSVCGTLMACTGGSGSGASSSGDPAGSTSSSSGGLSGPASSASADGSSGPQAGSSQGASSVAVSGTSGAGVSSSSLVPTGSSQGASSGASSGSTGSSTGVSSGGNSSSGVVQPSVAFVLPTEGAVLTGDVAVQLAVIGAPSSVSLTLNGQLSLGEVAPPYALTLPTGMVVDGEYTLTADAVFDTGALQAVVHVTLDRTGPRVLQVVPGNGGVGFIRGGTAVVRMDSAPADPVAAAQAFSVRLNQGAALPVTATADGLNWTLPIPDEAVAGTQVTVEVDGTRFVDAVGNPATSAPPFVMPRAGLQLLTEVTAPIAPVGAAGADGWLQAMSNLGALTAQYHGRASHQGGFGIGLDPKLLAAAVGVDGAWWVAVDSPDAQQQRSTIVYRFMVQGGTGQLESLIYFSSGTELFPGVPPVLVPTSDGGMMVAHRVPGLAGGDGVRVCKLLLNSPNLCSDAFGLGIPSEGPKAAAVVGDKVYVAVSTRLASQVRLLEWSPGQPTLSEHDALPVAARGMALVGKELGRRHVLTLAVSADMGELRDIGPGPDLQVYELPDPARSNSFWRLLDGVGSPSASEVNVLNDAHAPQLVLDLEGRPILAFREVTTEGVLRPGQVHLRVMKLLPEGWESFSAPLPPDVTNFQGLQLGLDRLGAPTVFVAAGTGSGAQTAWRSFSYHFNTNDPGHEPLPARVTSSPCVLPHPPPALLSQTGCFTDVANRVPADGVVPYGLNAMLWSDGADKARWMVLPAGGLLGFDAAGNVSVPVGTITIKDFMIPLGDAQNARQMAETRFMVKRAADQWQGYTYEWRADGTDADLLPAPDDPVNPLTMAKTRAFTRADQSTHTHTYPTRTQCLRCHNATAGFVLGPNWGQLNKPVDWGSAHGNQLKLLEEMGYLTAATPPAVATLPSPWDLTQPLESRARAYLHTNCASCHQTGAEGGAILDLRFNTPLADTKLCLNNRLVPVTSGDPATARLHVRMAATPGNGAPMPPLARLTVDQPALDLMDQWILSRGSTCP